MSAGYVPQRGDILWITLDPVMGREQYGRRPAIVLSRSAYNRTTGLAFICPITSRRKGYQFEVLLPAGLAIAGVVLVDHARSVAWSERNAEFACVAPRQLMADEDARL